MAVGHEKISKKEFYRVGGFSNPNLFRKMIGKSWAYFRVHDN